MPGREVHLERPRVEQHLGRVEAAVRRRRRRGRTSAVGDVARPVVAVAPSGRRATATSSSNSTRSTVEPRGAWTRTTGTGAEHARLRLRGIDAATARRPWAPLDGQAASSLAWVKDEVADVATVHDALSRHGYLPDEGLATAVFLAISLQRPLLLEGEAGVGKTELAKVLATWTGGELIRLQCYEGIDAAQAVYDWDYGRQLLHLRAAEATGESAGRSADALEAELYQERFLVKRALLRAIEPREGPPPVLLIDEIDRADDEFEAYLLEILSDWQITIPELGVFRTDRPPLVVLTSNRTRDVHDALKRRCLYHWVEHPGFEREVAIVRLRVPDVGEGARPPGRRRRRGAARPLALQAARRGRDDRLGRRARPPRRSLARRGLGRGPRSAPCSSTARITQRVEQHGFADIVRHAVARGAARD